MRDGLGSAESDTQKVLNELKNQKFALDQHAIVAMTDVAGKITYVNDKFCQISKFSREELIGQDHRIINSGHHPKEFFQDIWSTLRAGKVWHGEIKNRAKDGSIYWVDSTLVPAKNEEGTVDHYIAIRADVTARKALEESLLDANSGLQNAAEEALFLAQQAKEANQYKTEFLANMSHEIRTPMNGIMGFVEFLLESELDEEQREHAEIIHRSATSLLDIINDILDFSKIEAGRMMFELVDFDFHRLARDVCELIGPRLDNKRAKMICRIDPEVPCWIKADSVRVRQIITNLLGNAIKFTSEGEVELHLSLKQRQGNVAKITIEVRDTGVGIAEDKQSGIFEVFQQGDGSTTRQFGGTGLGLSIVKRIVDHMEGEISLQSQVGHGSTFTVTLPLIVGEATEKKPNTPVCEEGSSDTTENDHTHVLLVEDNPTNQLLVQKLLEKAGYTVDLADDGQEGLDKVRAQSYDVVLMDMQMPVMGGLEATEAIRKSGLKDLPIIAITANVMVADRDRCIAAGMNDFLTKPINRDDLLGKINKWTLMHRHPESDEITI